MFFINFQKNKHKFRATIVIVLTACAIASCRKEGCLDPNAINYDHQAEKNDGSCLYNDSTDTVQIFKDTIIDGESYAIIGNTIETDLYLSADTKWLMTGHVNVIDGVTLTISSGTTIYASQNSEPVILNITKGGKIIAIGSESLPIIFTSVSENPQPGDWGGLMIDGNAPTNNPYSDGDGWTGGYGGTDASDNSGSLLYVRIEYGGAISGTDNYVSGLTLRGVGNGTSIDYIQAYKCAGAGFRIYGGSVNVRHVISSGNLDDGFRWLDGWVGKGQFLVIEQSFDSKGKALEGTSNWDIEPFSNPQLSNITLVGKQNSNHQNDGAYFREGTKGKVHNMLVANFFHSGVRVAGTASLAYMNTGDLIVKNTIAFNNAINWLDCLPFESDPTNSSMNPNVLQGVVGTVSTNAVDPLSIDGWFQPATYIGAIPTNGNWSNGWTRSL